MQRATACVIVAASFVCAAAPATARADEPGVAAPAPGRATEPTARVVFRDGAVLEGPIVSRGADTLVLRLPSGEEHAVRSSEVQSVEERGLSGAAAAPAPPPASPPAAPVRMTRNYPLMVTGIVLMTGSAVVAPIGSVLIGHPAQCKAYTYPTYHCISWDHSDRNLGIGLLIGAGVGVALGIPATIFGARSVPADTLYGRPKRTPIEAALRVGPGHAELAVAF